MCNSKKIDSTSSMDIVGYSYPQLYIGKEWYVGFYAFDPARGTSRRKRYKINYIGSTTKKRRFASHLITKLTEKLEQGWNPWIEVENSNSYHLFSDVCANYVVYLTKMYNDRDLREKTFIDYNYRLQALIKWNLTRRVPITYIYQVNRQFLQQFLDYIYIEQNNKPRTRNNYLNWLKSFSGFLVDKFYLTTRPTEGIASLRVSSKKTDRTIIADNDLVRLYDYLNRENKHYLLACYIMHYALIRPKEMSYLRVGDFSLDRQTIFVSGRFSKNHKDAIVTLPAKVAKLMIDLQIFSTPSNYYIFGAKFRPSEKRRDEKQFREYWANLRNELKFPFTYKFYSLKDTGITNMLRTCDVITVRDQARHSSILMTNIYTPQDIQSANDLLKNYQGNF